MSKQNIEEDTYGNTINIKITTNSLYKLENFFNQNEKQNNQTYNNNREKPIYYPNIFQFR